MSRPTLLFYIFTFVLSVKVAALNPVKEKEALIMDWICLVLDAHFTVVVMLPEARGLLSNLHKFVRAQVRLYSELNKIEGSLKELQKIQHTKDAGLYSIEVLKL